MLTGHSEVFDTAMERTGMAFKQFAVQPTIPEGNNGENNHDNR